MNREQEAFEVCGTRGMKAIELCAGGGGSSLGLESAGFAPAMLIDDEPNACATLRQNRPHWNIIEDDLRKADFRGMKDIALVSGGLPCPPYSIAGVQRGSADERDLFPDMLRIVQDIMPCAVLIENVRGLMSSKFASVRGYVNKALRDMGFIPEWNMLNASGFGVPQNRTRTFLVALRERNATKFQWPIPSTPTLFVGGALRDLLAADGWVGAEEWANKARRFLSPTLTGGSKKHGGPDLGPTRARKEWQGLGVHPFIIDTKPPAREDNGRLCLTVRMLARLQGFPDDWEFFGSKTQQCRQIGNALPPPLMAAVARQVAKCLS